MSVKAANFYKQFGLEDLDTNACASKSQCKLSKIA